MTRYSVQPSDQIFVKGYGFLSFAKNMSKNISKILRVKYSHKLHLIAVDNLQQCT